MEYFASQCIQSFVHVNFFFPQICCNIVVGRKCATGPELSSSSHCWNSTTQASLSLLGQRPKYMLTHLFKHLWFLLTRKNFQGHFQTCWELQLESICSDFLWKMQKLCKPLEICLLILLRQWVPSGSWGILSPPVSFTLLRSPAGSSKTFTGPTGALLYTSRTALDF